MRWWADLTSRFGKDSLAGNLYDNGSSVSIAIGASGTVSATSGPAISAESGGPTFSPIVNRKGGLIGGLATSFDKLDNGGVIDGGQDFAAAPLWACSYRSNEVPNGGLITSSGGAATIPAGGNIAETICRQPCPMR